MRFVFVMPRLLCLPLRRSVYWLLLTTIGCVGPKQIEGATDWPATLTHESRGNFPDLRPVRATYVYGWSGITAATSEVYFHHSDQQTFVLEGRGRTVGLARILWRFDLTYRAVANPQTLRPLESHQVEMVRSKRIETNLKFSDEGVRSKRSEGSQAPKVKDFTLQNLYDLHSVFLYLRSQPLSDHSVYRLAVYPATSAYFATVTVVGREHVRVRAGSYSAIKADLKLQRVNKANELEPHRKFKRASVWISDDTDRLLLRIESQIFVGAVTAELQSVRFENN